MFELSLTSLEQFIPFFIRIKFLLFSSLAQHFWGTRRIHPNEPQHCIFGDQRVCAAHQGIASRDVLHENTSGGCAGDSENVLI